jgi:hypothetical protein
MVCFPARELCVGKKGLSEFSKTVKEKALELTWKWGNTEPSSFPVQEIKEARW